MSECYGEQRAVEGGGRRRMEGGGVKESICSVHLFVYIWIFNHCIAKNRQVAFQNGKQDSEVALRCATYVFSQLRD